MASRKMRALIWVAAIIGAYVFMEFATMPVDRTTRLSISQFAELIGVEPERLIDVEVNRPASTITLVLEPVEPGHMHGPDPTGHP